MGAAVTNSAFRFLMANPAFLTMVGYSSEELQQLSIFDICVDGEAATNTEFRCANCAKACVFNMSSKHSTVVRTELLFRSTRTFQRLAGGRRISKRFLHSQSTLRRARQPKMPCARLNRSLGGLLD